jgi:hypothetical protein
MTLKKALERGCFTSPKDNVMLYKLSLFNRILRACAIRLFTRVENNNVCEFAVNGEKRFLENLFDLFPKTRKIVFLILTLMWGGRIFQHVAGLFKKERIRFGNTHL